MNAKKLIKEKFKYKLCPRCKSNNIYYAVKGTPNDDIVQCGDCNSFIEINKLLNKRWLYEC